MPARGWGEHDAAHDNWIALDIVAAISRVVGPGDLEIRYVLAVDLVQRREPRSAVVPVRAMPGEKSLALSRRVGIGWREFLGFCGRDNLIEWQFFALFRIFQGPIFARSGAGVCARAFIPELGHPPPQPAQIFLEKDLPQFITIIHNND